MPDPLASVLAAAEHPRPVVTADATRWWPGWAVPALVQAGVLVADAEATSVACAECGEGHVEAVEAVDTPGRPRRWFHPCPRVGRARVESERLRRWVVVPAAFGAKVAGREATVRLVGCVWGLGVVQAGATARPAWLAAGWRGLSGLAERVPELVQPTAAVFVPHTLPPMGVWGRSVPRRIVPLSAVLTLTADGLVVDPVALAAHLESDGDDPPAEPLVIPTDPAGGPPVPLPPGTAWEDVTVEVDDHHLLVRTADGRWRVGYVEAGFGDGRNGAPNSRWALLRLLAKSGGQLGTGDAITTKSDLLTRSVSDLRAALRSLTGLTTNPFRPTRRGEAYHTRFRIRLVNSPPLEAD